MVGWIYIYIYGIYGIYVPFFDLSKYNLWILLGFRMIQVTFGSSNDSSGSFHKSYRDNLPVWHHMRGKMSWEGPKIKDQDEQPD